MLSAIVGLLLAVRFAYSSPVDYDVVLAGNFGEPRPNHFHCGIDIKTGGVEGKKLSAISDGYVSRITVGLNGFGNALYITHPDGNVSVYCHLKSFAPRITKELRKWQYANGASIADVRLAPSVCPVARGQFVAVSGNTGASSAPHLHLELHDAKNGHIKDPLDVIGWAVNDSQPPIAHAFMAYPVKGEGVFDGSPIKRSYGFSSHELPHRFTAWGKVGFGIWANDYMEATYNRYGVRETALFVDGEEVFRSTVDNLPPMFNRQINYLFDYDHYCRYGVWYARSFILPGVTMPFVSADCSRGIVEFSEERDYHIEYRLSDYFGNTAVYKFVVTGERTDFGTPKRAASCVAVRYDRLSRVSMPGCLLVLPRGTLAEDITLAPRRLDCPSSFSPNYLFCDKVMPLMSWAELSIAVAGTVSRSEKLYIETSDGRYCGGAYHNGWVTASVRELGVAYHIANDDTPPEITPLSRGRWNADKTIRYKIADSGSGLKSFKGYVDGCFVLFERLDKSNVVVCDLECTPVRRTGKRHEIKLEVVDNRNNTAVVKDNILY